MLTLVLSFLMSFALVYAICPAAIRIAQDKGLVADPVARSSHKKSTPIVGGIPIFIGIIFTSLLLTPHDEWKELQYILSAVVIVFMVGTKDDIENLSPLHKIGGLIIAIAILVSRGGVELQGMYGLFGLSTTFPTWACMIISGFTLLVITNAFNLIDGINGLAGTVGSICSITFGIWFFMVDQFYLGVLSMTTAGSLLAFLRFNMTPAKTFMGDTGSLVLGLLLGVMAVKFIDLGYSGEFPSKYRFDNPIAVAVGILIVPLFDTIRVFTTRALRGKSPLKPDRRHIHHLLIDSGYSHMEGSAILGIFNLLFISMVFYLDDKMGLHYLIGLELGLALLLTFFLHRNVRRINSGIILKRGSTELKQPS
ncbi:UDP-N-acetylmuramyl pentapeptide phosphotransferase/UDP-N-acetylglucosamine-1-phosphate transferase [Neolewinella agarilytica]|uniref:UDP-N-acetylmuramyl pentapeptide phosphotransferase/UDP-N-acetylglucosamine-1-phosphate transferase n=2 Tax=Neolewinella agarilytica TaxID=478744 RepID=A0A1H9PAU9_9BACT|nr:MraY family glycosyltransferase [Neolewinella agarilytica]SER45330.1 UDP-N-acetylmuramyl pentapeptide phosphotransferase/UDP-N-acetylglucosamine-1-phosphate transferase [Neolewinella agarilytica]